MRTPLAAIVSAAVAIVSLAAQAPAPAPTSSAPMPRYEVKRASSPITVDGKLDDAAWAGASPAVTLQFLWDSQTGAKQETHARVSGTPRHFYVGFDADDADINARFEQRDDPTYQDDAVEIFINPDPKQEALYYGFEMNARGVLYDYLNYNSRTLFKRWDATGVKIADLNSRNDEQSNRHRQGLESGGCDSLGELRRAFPPSARRRSGLEGELQPVGRRSAGPPHEHLVRSAEH